MDKNLENMNRKDKKKERKKKAKLDAKRKARFKKLLTRLKWTILFLVIVASIAGLAYVSIAPAEGELFESQGSEHIPVTDEEIVLDYNSNPPTSGPHAGSPAEWGYYEFELPDEQLIHNIEHGGIWISYIDLPEEQLKLLEEFANEHPESVIVTKRAKNDSNISIASWQRLTKLEGVDMNVIEGFYKANKNKSPEPLAGK